MLVRFHNFIIVIIGITIIIVIVIIQILKVVRYKVVNNNNNNNNNNNKIYDNSRNIWDNKNVKINLTNSLNVVTRRVTLSCLG
jgi:hypothetical protein